MNPTCVTDRFIEKARLVSACVHQAKTMDAAFDLAADIIAEKPVMTPLMQQDASSGNAGRIVAAPNLDESGFKRLKHACLRCGNVTLVRENLRAYPGGIDAGVTLAAFGIAETGTLVIPSDSEETRLATMLSELHVAVLKQSHIKETAFSITEELEQMMEKSGAYTAFVTGASRTADIERVLALGVHGPLELHIIISEA